MIKDYAAFEKEVKYKTDLHVDGLKFSDENAKANYRKGYELGFRTAAMEANAGNPLTLPNVFAICVKDPWEKESAESGLCLLRGDGGALTYSLLQALRIDKERTILAFITSALAMHRDDILTPEWKNLIVQQKIKKQ